MAVNERVAIVGAGLIGRSWAIVFAGGGNDVALYDPSGAVLAQAPTLVAEAVTMLAQHGLVTDPKLLQTRIRICQELDDALQGATFVQESGPETLEAKCQIFGDLDRLAPTEAILASSTSTITASRFTEQLSGRHRCLVAHPVNPPHLIPLVELVAAPWTAPAIVQKAKAVYEAAGQVPIVVRHEIDGFILNRLQAVLLSEAFRLVQNGYVTPQDLDKTLRDGLGLRWSFMGPFETIELNAPGGIPDYCERYGPSLARLSGADAEIYGPARIASLLTQWSVPSSPEEIVNRMRWRDRRLAALKGHKQAQQTF